MRTLATALRAVTSVSLQVVLVACLLFMAVIFAGQVTIVLLRYVMGVGFLELQDLVTYAFSALVVLAVPLAQWRGRHVRVDVLRNMMGPRTTGIVERVAATVLILPVFGLLTVNAWPVVVSSFAILEGSRETGGLGGLFLVKGTVIVMAALVILIAVGTILGAEAEDGE